MTDLTSLLERLKAAPKARLHWRVQFQTPRPRKGDRLMHYAFSNVGTFEIYEGESGPAFLLSFPKRLRKPAELFHDLRSAKTHAEVALQSTEAPHV